MKTKIIGLTGGIGSGKTTVAKKIQSLGIPVYFADDRAKILMNDVQVAQQIKSIFGKDVYVNGILQRQVLANKIFKDKEKLAQMNAIVHPLVSNDFENWLYLHSKYKVVVKEAAILFETGSYKNCDFTILVTAPQEVRIQRVMKRDGVSKEQILDRMNNQWRDEIKKNLADFIFINDCQSTFDKSFSELLVFLNKI